MNKPPNLIARSAQAPSSEVRPEVQELVDRVFNDHNTPEGRALALRGIVATIKAVTPRIHLVRQPIDGTD